MTNTTRHGKSPLTYNIKWEVFSKANAGKIIDKSIYGPWISTVDDFTVQLWDLPGLVMTDYYTSPWLSQPWPIDRFIDDFPSVSLQKTSHVILKGMFHGELC